MLLTQVLDSLPINVLAGIFHRQANIFQKQQFERNSTEQTEEKKKKNGEKFYQQRIALREILIILQVFPKQDDKVWYLEYERE